MTLAINISLTKRENELLHLLSSSIEARGCTPSYRELMQLLGLSSPATIHKHIQNIKKKGYLKEAPDSRQLVPCQKPSDETIGSVPVIGSVVRGEKLQFFSKVTLCHLPRTLIAKNSSYYGFIASDDSFSAESILQGDLLIIETKTAPTADALILAVGNDSGAEIGRYVPREVCLVSSVTKTPLLYLENPTIQIKGVVSSLLRSYVINS
jgi:repressor LexA